MAKKKRRSANVARKREKRNRNQKSKHKQLALEKQRKLQLSKLDEEGIFNLLMKSRDFINEPEFEKVHFDIDETMAEISKFIEQADISVKLNFEDEDDNRISENSEETNSNFKSEFFQSMNNAEVFWDAFLSEMLVMLVTPEIIGSLKVALSSSERRFKRTGDRSRADVAFVARTFFDVAPKDQYAEHPIFEGIMVNTFRQISMQELSANTEMHHGSEVTTDTINANIHHLDDTISHIEQQSSNDSVNDTFKITYQQLQNGSISDTVLPFPITNTLPAKALYRNCIGIEIRELLNNWEVNHPESYNALYSSESDQEINTHMHITRDRLHLFAHCEEKLTIAMDALETYCQSEVMFLAKTFDEGGDSDGTE